MDQPCKIFGMVTASSLTKNYSVQNRRTTVSLYVNIQCLLFLVSFLGTGRRTNRWSLVTYRLALAVYTRSPAAYQALKGFGVLQLPCKKSLQGFLSANQSEPGVNEEKIAEQIRLYDAARRVKEKKKKPQQKGVLIFDEVKVQSKVRVTHTDGDVYYGVFIWVAWAGEHLRVFLIR